MLQGLERSPCPQKYAAGMSLMDFKSSRTLLLPQGTCWPSSARGLVSVGCPHVSPRLQAGGLLAKVAEGLQDTKNPLVREGSLRFIRTLSEVVGIAAEPVVVPMLPQVSAPVRRRHRIVTPNRGDVRTQSAEHDSVRYLQLRSVVVVHLLSCSLRKRLVVMPTLSVQSSWQPLLIYV